MITPVVANLPAGQVEPLSDVPESSEALALSLYALIVQQPFFKGLNSQ